MSTTSHSGCVLWPWRRDRHGYGSLNPGGVKGAHRVIYTLFVGPIPRGMCVLHTCDTPACVNPQHLKLGTHQENMADKVGKRRHAHGVRGGGAKLTREQVREIREGLSVQEAKARFGIGKSTFYAARSGDTYADVSGAA